MAKGMLQILIHLGFSVNGNFFEIFAFKTIDYDKKAINISLLSDFDLPIRVVFKHLRNILN